MYRIDWIYIGDAPAADTGGELTVKVREEQRNIANGIETLTLGLNGNIYNPFEALTATPSVKAEPVETADPIDQLRVQQDLYALILSWRGSADLYLIRWRIKDATSPWNTDTSKTQHWTHSPLVAGRSYEYQVAAVKNNTISAYSATVYGTVLGADDISPVYLGRYNAQHPVNPPDGAVWTVFDTDDTLIQRGVYYSNRGTPVRITTSSAQTLQAKMSLAFVDIAWCEDINCHPGLNYGTASDYGMETYFYALAAVQALITKIFAQELTMTGIGKIKSENFSEGVSGYRLTGTTGILEAVAAILKDCTISGTLAAGASITGTKIRLENNVISIISGTSFSSPAAGDKMLKIEIGAHAPGLRFFNCTTAGSWDSNPFMKLEIDYYADADNFSMSMGRGTDGRSIGIQKVGGVWRGRCEGAPFLVDRHLELGQNNSTAPSVTYGAIIHTAQGGQWTYLRFHDSGRGWIGPAALGFSSGW